MESGVLECSGTVLMRGQCWERRDSRRILPADGCGVLIIKKSEAAGERGHERYAGRAGDAAAYFMAVQAVS